MSRRTPGSPSFDHEAELCQLYPRLWRYCLVTTGSRTLAEDLAQAACLRSLEKIEQFEVGTRFDAWMFRIARNTWINELRSQAVRRGGGLVPADDIDLADSGDTPESNFSGREALRLVMALPEAQRITTLLAYVEGYAYKEIATMLDIPIGTVMSRLAASRQRLASQLNDTRSSTDLQKQRGT